MYTCLPACLATNPAHDLNISFFFPKQPNPNTIYPEKENPKNQTQKTQRKSYKLN